MANIEKQMEMFGYTAEGAKQEADKLAADVNTDLTFKEAATAVGSMLPGVGTAMTVAEIEDELKQENPNYGKIALLGGAEIVGLVPGLGTAAKSGLKAAAKRLGVDKLIKAIDAPKPEDAVKLEAGFTGTNPPTYEPRVDVKPKLAADEIFFRKPIIQFVRSLDVPKKGILGSNFSKLVEKNSSISPTSLQKQLINPKKRYSKEELEDIFKSNEFSTAAMPKKSPYKSYEKNQRQHQVGFRGGSEQEYFEIPIKSFARDANIAFKSKAFRKLQKERKEGKPELLEFKPKEDTHFGDKAIAHLRGSIINPRYHQNVESIVDLTSTHPEFDKIIKNENFLLVEELQSNLISGGFLKSNFNDIYDEAISTYDSANLNRYDRVFRTTDGNSDRKLRDLIKKIDKENPALPDSFIYKHKLEYGVKGEKLINEDGKILNRKEALSPFEFEDYLRDKLKSEGLEEIPRRNFEDFFAQYRKSISKKADTDSPPFIEYGQPPITKNKQAVEELIKVAIGKAANENVNYVVFPNVTRIKLAREKIFNPNDKGDLFYQTYFKQLNSALSDLEKNYPVKIYDNVNLPYDDKAFIQTMASTFPDVPNTYLETLRLGQSYRTPDEINEIIDSSGTVVDITDLVKKFKVEEPRQFAEGGITMRPEPRPETRPFPDVKPQERPEERSEFITRGYEIDGREVQVGIIKFKGGEEIALDKVIENIDAKGTANEPVITKNTVTQVLNFIEKNNPTREEFETYWYNKRLNKGGSVGDQMQMAFMNEGGLTDDGMDKDPVSGNEVPSGSMAEEVRDNIPAQLSEGEYVVPADVVRYYGVKFFEDLRDRAKMGLAEMEANGRIGGEPVPAGGPVNNEELSPQEMQAIREVMGMAEGGDVQNPYMQQQLLYSQPRPAPIDDQKDTVVDITNPVQNQMPVQNMSSGGQVQGYQNSSVVTNQNSGLEQNFLQQGQQAVNRGFVGFPLGATIFPSEKTGQTALGPIGTQVATTGAIDTAITGTAGTDNSMLTTVTLYGPNGEVVVLTLPTDQARYDELIAQGYSTTPPVTIGSGDDDDDDDDKPKTDPNAWMDKFNYNDLGELGTQTSDMLKKAPFGGAIGAFINGSTAAQAAANIIIMKANGQETAKLEEEWNKFVQGDLVLKNLPKEFINGDRFAKEIMLKNIRLAQSKATDLDGKPIFEDDQDFRDHMSQVLPETVSSPGLSGSTAASQAEVEKEQDVMSQTVVSQPTGSPTTVAGNFAEFDKILSGGGSGDNGGSSDDKDPPSYPNTPPPGTSSTSNNSGMSFGNTPVSDNTFNTSSTPSEQINPYDVDEAAINKGGLMTTPKKKKKRQPKKGGLAGRK